MPDTPSVLRFGLIRPRPTPNPHFSVLKQSLRLEPNPAIQVIDYLVDLPDSLGMMGNDTCGNCFWAAQYHGDQLRTLLVGGQMLTQPAATVQQAYAQATGWSPGDPGSDRGTDAGEGFAWIQANGLPLARYGQTVKLLGAVEVDPEKPQDCLVVMDYCGGLCVGVTLPKRLAADPSPKVWDWLDGDELGDEGHEVLVGKLSADLSQIGFVSWGSKDWTMTRRFWEHCVVQVTGAFYADWLGATGRTPFGMDAAGLEAMMQAHSGGRIP